MKKEKILYLTKRGDIWVRGNRIWNKELSYIEPKSNNPLATSPINLSEVLDYIKKGDLRLNHPELGNLTLKEATEMISDIGIMYPHVACILERELVPGIIFNGQITWLDKDDYTLFTYSNITVVEILAECLKNSKKTKEQMINEVKKKNYIVCIFTNPRNGSVNCVVKHDNTDYGKHEQLHFQLMNDFGLPYYPNKCFTPYCIHHLYYDPNIWVNPNTIVPYHFEP